MTEETYQEVLEEYINKVTSFVKDEGGINPHIVFIADRKELDEDGEMPTAIVHLDIPNFDREDITQDQFVEGVLPQIFTQIKEDFNVKALAFTAEAYVRVADKDFDPEKEDFRKIPVEKEILLISLETADKSEVVAFEIKKDGQMINPDGKLIDKIELVKESSVSMGEATGGVYNNLWKKYML